MKSKAIIVLGMHRSGTSVLTRALAAVGVYLGNQLMPGKPDNPKGFFEDLGITRLNLELLTELGCYWDSLQVPDWQSLPNERQCYYCDVAVSLIRQRFGHVDLWAFKDPRVIRLMTFWVQVLKQADFEPVFILCNRHPLSVADSLARRDQMPLGQALLLWLVHQNMGLEVILETEGLIVDYDALMEAPSLHLERLRSFLNLRLGDDEQEQKLKFERQFLDHGLRHGFHQLDGCDLDFDELGRICRKLYLYLRKYSFQSPNWREKLGSESHELYQEIASYLVDQKELLNSLNKYIDNHHTIEAQYHGLAREHHELTDRYHGLAREHHELTDRYHGLAREHHELTDRYHGLAREHHELTDRYHGLVKWREELWTEILYWQDLAENQKEEIALLRGMIREMRFEKLRKAYVR